MEEIQHFQSNRVTNIRGGSSPAIEQKVYQYQQRGFIYIRARGLSVQKKRGSLTIEEVCQHQTTRITKVYRESSLKFKEKVHPVYRGSLPKFTQKITRFYRGISPMFTEKVHLIFLRKFKVYNENSLKFKEKIPPKFTAKAPQSLQRKFTNVRENLNKQYVRCSPKLQDTRHNNAGGGSPISEQEFSNISHILQAEGHQTGEIHNALLIPNPLSCYHVITWIVSIFHSVSRFHVLLFCFQK